MRLTPNAVRSLALAGAVCLAACTHAPTRPDTTSTGARAAEIARSMVGVRYVYGGESPSGFDCSGLAQYAYARVGLVIPRDSVAQRRSAERVPLAHALPGDLLFFDTDWNRHHVGIYLGSGRFVHAPSRGKHVTIDSLDDDYFKRRLVGVGRFR
jgi:cell wall-associated NlpC family hydrolase